MRAWLVTTFPNNAWEVYARECLQALAKYLLENVKIIACLDDAALEDATRVILRKGDAVHCGWAHEHQAFVARNKDKDHKTDYHKQAVRFCHKFFMLKKVLAEMDALKEGRPEYLIWWDADAIIRRPVTGEDMRAILPRAGEAASTLGRKNWDHSECGFIGFNLAEEGAGAIIDFVYGYYVQDFVFSLPQWHDSYIFDVARQDFKCRNISEDIPGNNVWAATALGKFSEHRKGQEAKARGRALTDAEFFDKE